MLIRIIQFKNQNLVDFHSILNYIILSIIIITYGMNIINSIYYLAFRCHCATLVARQKVWATYFMRLLLLQMAFVVFSWFFCFPFFPDACV